jgi:hypothetical protein
VEPTPDPNTIEARQITKVQLRAITDRHFGTPFGGPVDLAREILEHLRVFAPDYQVGDWRYYELSNGGFYAAPVSSRLQVTMNQTVEMSDDAAGLATCLFLLEGLGVLDARLMDHHQRLQGFADQHPEAELIRLVSIADEVSDVLMP